MIYLFGFIGLWALFIYLFRKSGSGIVKILGSLVLALFVIAIAAAIFQKKEIKNANVDNETPTKTQEIVYNSPWDGSVAQVESWLRKNLKDPDSYKGIEWSPVAKVDNQTFKYMVRHKYRAKNSFGGYVVENKTFFLDANGNVMSATDR